MTKLKRRANLLYRLRKKGVDCDTKKRTIYIPYGDKTGEHVQISRLCKEFHFVVQFMIDTQIEKKMDTTLNIEQIEHLLVGRSDSPFYIRRYLVVPNVSWGFLTHEADLVAVSQAGYMTEIEIKRSWSDFMADFKKKHYHRDRRISQMYYAVPSKIARKVFHHLYNGYFLPDNKKPVVVEYNGNNINKCGLIVYYDDNPYLDILVSPVKINQYKLGDNEIKALMRLGCMRVWSLKGKVARLQSDLNQTKVIYNENRPR